MPTALPLPLRINQSATRSVKQRVFQAQFGDGYWLTAGDGPNNIMEEWDGITWDALTRTERDEVVTALRKGALDYLTWQPGNDLVSKKYLIRPISSGRGSVELYRESMQSGNLFTITTNLSQVP